MLRQIMDSKQFRFPRVNSPLQRRGPPYVSSAPPQCPLHWSQHPVLPFGRICNPIPPGGSPSLSTAPISCPWWLLWSLLFPWSLGQRKLRSHPWGPAYPQHRQGIGPHHREPGPSSSLCVSLPVLKAGGVGTDIRDWVLMGKFPKIQLKAPGPCHTGD